jgi:hypothetical protein
MPFRNLSFTMHVLRIEVSFHSAIFTISFCEGVSLDIVVHKRVGVRTARRAFK